VDGSGDANQTVTPGNCQCIFNGYGHIASQKVRMLKKQLFPTRNPSPALFPPAANCCEALAFRASSKPDDILGTHSRLPPIAACELRVSRIRSTHYLRTIASKKRNPCIG